MAAGGGERVIQASPIPIGGGRVIASPFQFAVTGEDHLRVAAWNTQPGARVGITWRFIDAATNEIKVGQDTLVPTSNAAINIKNVPLSAGFILNLIITASGDPKLGQTFVRVLLMRGFTGALLAVGTMLQGYVTTQQVLAWPGSPIANSDSVEGHLASPALTPLGVGVGATVDVPAGLHWTLLAATITALTSGVAGLRRGVVLVGFAGANYMVYHPQTVGPGLAWNFSWATGLTGNADMTNQGASAPLATPTSLDAFCSIVISIFNNQAGDAYVADGLAVRQRLEVI